MTKFEKLDALVEMILNKFEENEITASIIRKICTMYDSYDPFIVGNHIENKSKNMYRKIEINPDTKTIKYEDRGTKDNKQYINKSSYKETEYGTIAHQKRLEFITRYEDDLIIEEQELVDCYKYYKNNEIIGLSETKRVNKKKSTKNNQIIKRNISKSQKTLYKLLNGDVIKITEDNTGKKYFYCDSSELKQDNSNNIIRINKEINSEEADQILASNTSTFDIINNEIVESIRGTSYCRKF